MGDIVGLCDCVYGVATWIHGCMDGCWGASMWSGCSCPNSKFQPLTPQPAGSLEVKPSENENKV